jgi:hypothetical protein
MFLVFNMTLYPYSLSFQLLYADIHTQVMRIPN